MKEEKGIVRFKNVGMIVVGSCLGFGLLMGLGSSVLNPPMSATDNQEVVEGELETLLFPPLKEQKIKSQEVQYQTLEALSYVNETFTFEHLLPSEIQSEGLTYYLLNEDNEVLKSTSYTSQIEEAEVNRYQVSFSLVDESLEPLLKIAFGWGSPTYYVSDFNPEVSQVTFEDMNFRGVFQNQSLILLNQQRLHYTYKQHDFYGESLHLAIQEDDPIQRYQLISLNESPELPYFREANQGIELSQLEVGQYYLYLNQRPVYVNEPLYEVWYTIHREGKAKQLTLETWAGLLSIKVEEVEHVPSNVYDILIDAGHGGFDSGAVREETTEAEEVLKISTYLASRFADHGLKVKLTREDMEDPAQVDCKYETCPYVEGGRVEQIYRYQPKYLISNHLNALDKKTSGFQVYSSMVTDNRWALEIANLLQSMGREPHDVIENVYRVSEGTYKRFYKCDETDLCRQTYADYYYILRESGGWLTQSYQLVKFNSAYQAVPHYGAESILMEYAYLDCLEDYQRWTESWQDYAEVVVEATLTYLGIDYVKY